MILLFIVLILIYLIFHYKFYEEGWCEHLFGWLIASVFVIIYMMCTGIYPVW